ncbi:uncharacterized protein LOC126681480 [Mercurialis annua]|uniref:uncharacterized protein LOC126681480 n=1 Tax=Mercurialis annua TaxID=3986 RepID=UPI0021605A83|nr:uncharacterized protein LOC126681480 [Mercurialis annua]
MEEELVDRCANIRLTEDECTAINLEDVIDETLEHKANLSLVGKLLTKKPYNLSHMRNALTSAWRLAKGFEMRDIGDNLFVCEFRTKADKNRVLSDAPWHFDKQLIIFEPMSGNMQPNNMGLQCSPFWLRIYDLPLNCRGKAAISRIGGKVGRVVEWCDEGEGSWNRYSRVRVMIDVTKPLIRGTKIINPIGESCWISFKYERVQNFCYWCGLLDHTVVDCELKPDETDVTEWPYGAGLRATPRKRVLMGNIRSAPTGVRSRKEVDETNMHNVEPEVASTARRVLNLEENCNGVIADLNGPNQTNKGKNAMETQVGCKETTISTNVVTNEFVEVNVSQVQHLHQIPALNANYKSDDPKEGKKGKGNKKSTWSRFSGQRNEGCEIGEGSKSTGVSKRSLVEAEIACDPNNLFSKKARDGLLDKFDNIEISAEAVKQSRRKQ